MVYDERNGTQTNKKEFGGLGGIEPPTSSTLRKNHTTRPKPLRRLNLHTINASYEYSQLLTSGQIFWNMI